MANSINTQNVLRCLLIVLFAIISYLWHGVDTRLAGISERLRQVEIVNSQIIILLNGGKIADSKSTGLPGQPEQVPTGLLKWVNNKLR